MADFTAWAPIDWWAYYKRPLDTQERLRRMGCKPFPCLICRRDSACGKSAAEGYNQCPHIRHWMYDFWPVLTGKIRSAHVRCGGR